VVNVTKKKNSTKATRKSVPPKRTRRAPAPKAKPSPTQSSVAASLGAAEKKIAVLESELDRAKTVTAAVLDEEIGRSKKIAAEVRQQLQKIRN
jgi:hypothetical protein